MSAPEPPRDESSAPDATPPRSASWIRDHLANERTLLAWVRTSLTFMAFGVAVAKLGLFLRVVAADHPGMATELPVSAHSQLVGAALVAVGGVIALVGLVKSRQWTRRIDPNGPAPRQRTLTLVAALAAGTGVALIVYLLT